VTEAGEAMLHLLRNPEERIRLGIAAKEHVRKNYLITRQVRDYLMVMAEGVKK